MIDIEQLRADMEAGTGGPWHYRPQAFDDWGYVRGPDRGDGWGPFICQAKAPTSEEFENECRRTGQDPWGPNARRIARLPDLEQAYLDMHEGCAEYLKEGETPAERLASNHREILALMNLFEPERRHAEAWVKAAREAEAKLAQQGDQIAALHEQNRKLREALTAISNAPSEMTWGEDTEVAHCLNKCEAIADAALAEGETG